MTTQSSESSNEDEIPLPSQQPLEVDFINHKVTGYRDTSGELPAKYDVKRKRFMERKETVTFRSTNATTAFDLSPNEMHSNELSLVATTESFNQAIMELQAKNKSKDKIAKFSPLSGCHDWTEVSQMLQQTETEYQNSESLSGKVRGAFRRVGDHSASIQSFVGLLPDGNYKTLCGGFTLILTAMGRHAEVREVIAQLLEALPDFVKDCEDYARIYPGQNMLKVRVNQLYVELLSALEEIIRWYTTSSIKRVANSLLHNSTYGEAIHKRVQNIERSRLRFHTEVQKFPHYRLAAMDETGLETNYAVHHIHQGVEGVQESIDVLSIETKTRDGMICKVMSDATSAINGTKELLADGIKNAEWNGNIKELVQQMMEDREKIDQERKDMEFKLQRKDSEIAKTGKLVNQLSQTPESLTERLELGNLPSKTDADLAIVHAAGLNGSISVQSRSRQIAETPEFQKWLRTSKSAALIVQENQEHEPISSLSFLVALLQENLDTQTKVLALPFFCGIGDYGTSDKSEARSRPMLLLRNLLARLLAQKTIDWGHGDRGRPCLSFISRETLSGLESSSFKAYLSVITDLVPILVRTHDCIFMMIDGVDFLDVETPKRTERLIKALIEMIKTANLRREEDVAGSIKVLWTASTHVEYFPRKGNGVITLDFQEDSDGDDDDFEELSDN